MKITKVSRTTSAILVVSVFLPVPWPSVARPTDPSDDSSAVIAPIIVAALIGAGVVVAGGTVAWINDQSNDVQVQGNSVATATINPTHCGAITTDMCTAAGFSTALCSTTVNNGCGFSATVNFAEEPFFGADTLSPFARAFAKGVHFEEEEHAVFAESMVQIDNTTRAMRAGLSGASSLFPSGGHPDGTVLATISIDDFTVQVRNSSFKTSSWDINYVVTPEGASPVEVFRSSGVLNSDGTISDLTGNIPNSLLTPFLGPDGYWTIELTDFSDEVIIGFLDVGEELDVVMAADATMEVNDALLTKPIPTVSEWGVVVMVLVLLVAGTIVSAGVRKGRSAAA